MKSSKYIVGIDLGTTHCVMAYTEVDVDENEVPKILIFQIPQITSPGELSSQPLLPSFLFLPGEHDAPPGSLALPWDADIDYTLGEFARNRGPEIPNRMVFSSKSWLCNNGVDRTKPILPWESPDDTKRVSPVEASSRLLSHLRNAWNHEMAADDPGSLLENQELYLTVPASFDAVARELTVKAAESAGLSNMTLLEEPQAAFYAWIESQQNWRKTVKAGESILVCDIGGGTTDLSLIQVVDEDGNLGLKRVAVGSHILLGGDNMDLALAYTLQAKLAKNKTKLDAWQFRGLAHSCRKAKENLLLNPELNEHPISILGRGSSLIKNNISTELTRSEIESVLLEGFFPVCESDNYPQEQSKTGLREMGLPYEADPAISRHLASFLGKHLETLGVPFPSTILFNGGVTKSTIIQQRILNLLDKWKDKQEQVKTLQSVDLELAVARGAAYFGLAKDGTGIRIKGGTARSYYIGIESSMPAVPGIPNPMKALCVIPFGLEDGTETDIKEREFGLVVDEPAVFNIMASSTRKDDLSGEVVEDWSGEIEEVATMESLLSHTEGDEKGAIVPVWLKTKLTEIGTLELWCVARDDESRQWKLEFSLRKDNEKED